MNETLELMLRILGLVLAAAGLVIVYAAPRIVDRRQMADRKEVPPDLAAQMTPEEQDKYRRDMVVLDVKLRGLALAAPGLILILIAFR